MKRWFVVSGTPKTQDWARQEPGKTRTFWIWYYLNLLRLQP